VAEDRPAYVAIFPSDWKGGTVSLTPLEEWVYLQVCLYNWDKGEGMPRKLQPAHLGRSATWAEEVDALVEIGKLTRTAGGSLMVPRALAEYRKASDALAKKVKAGRAGAKSRWNNNAQDGDAISPPDGGENGDMVFSVPPQAWADYREHRAKIKAPMSKAAERAIIKKLEAIKAEHGHDPLAVLEQSMRRGWRDVFPLKEDGNGANPRNSGRGLFDAC